MTQRLVVLTEKPKDIDVVTIFIQAPKDERVRLEVANRAPATLEDACKIANEAQALQRSVTNPHPANHNPCSRHLNGPQWCSGPPRANHTARPHIPRAYAIQPTLHQAQEVRLNRLDDETRRLCREQVLCYRCCKGITTRTVHGPTTWQTFHHAVLRAASSCPGGSPTGGPHRTTAVLGSAANGGWEAA
jgi:hypothetical protein